MAPKSSNSPFLADNPPNVVPLTIKAPFESLSPSQKLYAHHLSRACWHGTRITFRQVSPESEHIFDLILALHKACSGDYDQLASSTGLSDSETDLWLEYATQFLGNNGNYKGFGDVKFVPRISPEQLEKLCVVNDDCKDLLARASKAGGGLYETSTPELMMFGYPQDGHMTAYYPDQGGMGKTITKDEIRAIGDVCEKHDPPLLLENTRLRKLKSGDFEMLIASAQLQPSSSDRDLGNLLELPLTGPLNGHKLVLRYGDHSVEMARVARELTLALPHCANETEKAMLESYIHSFKTGSIESFKQSQREWIKDLAPPVETNIGFIETYRDCHGVRGEFEGFVAMVNQERTRAFQKLVKAAPTLIERLPWPKDFDKDKFNPPDFTSLEVLTFEGSGLPAGINIPNYDDIRQAHGFKNVSLGNVLSASNPNESIPFIHPSDLALYRRHREAAFEIQVGLHELLGHGTGKLLQETSPGKFNFDMENPPHNPVTGRKVDTWYGPGQTWGSVFSTTASSYEECRAECVAMVLGCEGEALRIFGFGDGKIDLDGETGDVLHVMYLTMARAGLAAMELYDPKAKKWGQIHMQCRFSILKCMLEDGDGVVSLSYTDKDTLDDLCVRVDRSKILTHALPSLSAYLQKLHVHKSTAAVAAGTALYDRMTSVDDRWATHIRDAVMRKRVARKVFVQANTVLLDGDGDNNNDGGRRKVVLKEYEATLRGMVGSWVERDV